MDVHDEECKYFLNTFENIEKQEFPLLLMEILDEPVETVLKLINKIRMKINDISTDKVPTVRKYFLEYIPNLLIKLRAVNNQSLNEYLYEYLVDTIFGQFFSEEVIFRQLARKIILHLLDRQLLTEAAVEQCVQNVLKSHANDDLPIFMFYIAPILGAEQTQKYFWKIFLEVIEGDPGSAVRKQCVRLVAILGSILGQEITERDLLPIFVKLSKTSEWTIRKECALELPKISVLCSRRSREQVLTPVMEEFLVDANKWVHTAAAEKLGIYIATFAEPEILTLAINQEGDLYVVNVADDNENYKEMLSEEKLKNFQFYEDMFAETLIPTGFDLGRTYGGVSLGKLFSSSSAAAYTTASMPPMYQDSMNANMGNSSKTIICDSAWYNSMSPNNPFLGGSAGAGGGGDSDRLVEAELMQATSKKEEEPEEEKKEKESDNPYQKFVHPNFLINLSSFIMNTSSCTSPTSSSSTTPPSPVVGTNPFHTLPPLLGMKLGGERKDFEYQNLYKKSNNINNLSNNNNKSSKREEQQQLEKENEAPAAGSSRDSNGNQLRETTSVKPDDLVNNNEMEAETPPLDTCPLDNNNKRDVMDTSNNNNNSNNNPVEAAGQEKEEESSQLEKELAKLSLTGEEDDDQKVTETASAVASEEDDVNKRTSSHLKRATPEGLPHVIKMAIKDKKKGKNKKGGLKGLTLPALPLDDTPADAAAATGASLAAADDEDNKNNNAAEDKESAEEDDAPSPPQTPSIEDAPTMCPFGGGGGSVRCVEKDDESINTPETARIMDMEEQKDLFACVKQESERDEKEEEVEYFSNNYWYVKPLELSLDDLEFIERSAQKDEEERRRKEEEHDLEKSLPPPPPPPENDDEIDDDEEEEDLPIPTEKRRLFSLYSIKYKYKLGEDSTGGGGGGGSGIMSSSMKACRDELLDNLYSNESVPQQPSHLMMVKKSDINPQLNGQQVLPPILLHFFLEMSNFPEWDQVCAYSFPAVVLTMGKSNWPLLKGQLQTLCCAIRWEVRQIVVASIYQIALIIGREYASQDLVPVFLGFFKDLDNVKIEALHNVAKFLQVIDKRRHIEVVAHLGECLEPENVTNWRFRKDLAQEIVKLMEIYKNDLEEHAEAIRGEQQEVESERGQDDLAVINEECLKCLTGYALRLLMDRVHCVREVAMEAIVSRIRFTSEAQLWDLLAIIVTAFAKSSHWRRRQIFGQLCEVLIQQEAIDMPEFEQRMLPVLIDMAEDKVPNVRLVVGKCLYKCAQSAYFTESLERRLKLEVILRQLENDSDRDVRASTSVAGFSDDSQTEETMDTNRTTYLDETIECEPPSVLGSSSVPEVVVLGGDEDQQEQNQTEEEQQAEERPSEEATEDVDQRP